jgi:hypothetical protein
LGSEYQLEDAIDRRSLPEIPEAKLRTSQAKSQMLRGGHANVFHEGINDS